MRVERRYSEGLPDCAAAICFRQSQFTSASGTPDHQTNDHSPLIRPGIHHGRAYCTKVSLIPRRQPRSPRDHNSGNHHVPHLHRSSTLLALRQQRRSTSRGLRVKHCDASIDEFRQYPFKAGDESSPAIPGFHRFQAGPDFKYGDRCGPHRLRRLAIQPTHNSRFRPRSHQCRHDICVQENQDSNSASFTGNPRNSSISCSRPQSRNRSLIAVPSPTLGASSFRRVLRRISRASASMLRPCRRARCCSCVFNCGSTFLTSNCAIPHLLLS